MTNTKMSAASVAKIREAVGLAGRVLDGNLPESRLHATRNAYAHIWRSIKEKMGKTYSECDESQVQEIIDHIHYLVNNPS